MAANYCTENFISQIAAAELKKKKKIIANSYFQIKLMLKNKLRKRLGKV